ncbi:MAG: hypothetical protein ACJ8AW_03570 [Rhodopila sp.]
MRKKTEVPVNDLAGRIAAAAEQMAAIDAKSEITEGDAAHLTALLATMETAAADLATIPTAYGSAECRAKASAAQTLFRLARADSESVADRVVGSVLKDVAG